MDGLPPSGPQSSSCKRFTIMLTFAHFAPTACTVADGGWWAPPPREDEPDQPAMRAAVSASATVTDSAYGTSVLHQLYAVPVHVTDTGLSSETLREVERLVMIKHDEISDELAATANATGNIFRPRDMMHINEAFFHAQQTWFVNWSEAWAECRKGSGTAAVCAADANRENHWSALLESPAFTEVLGSIWQHIRAYTRTANLPDTATPIDCNSPGGQQARRPPVHAAPAQALATTTRADVRH